jgi:hypothetical protein
MNNKFFLVIIVIVLINSCSPCKIIYCDYASKSDPVLICKDPKRFWPDFVHEHEKTIKGTLSLLESMQTNANFDVSTNEKAQLLYNDLNSTNARIRDILEADYRQLSEKPCDKDFRAAHIRLLSDLQKDLFVITEYKNEIQKIATSNFFGGSITSALQTSYDKYKEHTYIKLHTK